MPSISRRLLISVSLPLALFSGVMMLVLDGGFRALSERSLRELLDAQMVALIAAADPQPGGGYAPPAQTLDARLASPRSGLYEEIRSAQHRWRSPSTVGLEADFGPLLHRGERSLHYADFGHDRVAIDSRAIQFTDTDSPTGTYTFSVAVSLSPYEEQLWEFRREMLGWFAGLTLALLVTLAALLRWVLTPLRRLEREIGEVEEGRVDRLGERYPRELSGTVENLNALLVGERKRVVRYRDTLGNLAHSLKTPLAVMRSSLPGGAPGSTLSNEIDRMTGIIEHQLKRAAASGGALLGAAPVEVAQVAAELRATLLKVYARKDLAIELAVAPQAAFIGDRGDLTELLGNLLDNACKWCNAHVRLSAAIEPVSEGRARLKVAVEDDGPGVSQADRDRILERGVRTDETVPGHGIGLAMVLDTVELYGGALAIEGSRLGGACFLVRLPGRAVSAAGGA
ncbi:MAG: two-component sensor histidine kinase [Proteobacteria bacterium]|nr:two-component sensor histidine kinase [Pseudomonadota bacterium]